VDLEVAVGLEAAVLAVASAAVSAAVAQGEVGEEIIL
jgi:hypothetical protein